MKDFYEAMLTLEVSTTLAGAYKKAIEDENSRYLVKNELKNGKGEIIKEEIKPVWNGNHVHVDIDQSFTNTNLRIGIISHTLPNLKQTVDWYERQGAKVVYTSWERDSNG
jgi:hypothetical protein